MLWSLKKLKNDQVELFSLEGNKIKAKVVSVYDGDSCSIICRLGLKVVKFKTRLEGIDTPEIKPPKDQKNRETQIKAAKDARNRLIQLITDCNIKVDHDYKKQDIQNILDTNTKIIKITCGKWDKYGRLLITIPGVKETLIEECHAYKYDGGTKQHFQI